MKLFLAPHNDDETLFGAYTIMREKPLVVIVTDSWIQYLRGEGVTAEQRKKESQQAMRILGVPIEFLGIKDNELTDKALMEKLKQYRPTKVYAPLPNSKHPHHNLVGRVVHKLWPSKIIFYSTYTKKSFTPVGEIEIKPTREEIELKNKALDCYKSEIRITPHHFRAVRNKSEYLNKPWMEKVSAVLLSWKRPEELRQIKKHLSKIDFIDEIIVWENIPQNNKMSYGRYLGAKQAKNDIIYIQDDDCIVENIREIYTTFDGKHLSNGLRANNMLKYGRQKNNKPYTTLLGWGAFFKKEWIKVFDKYIEKYGEDELLCREADRIFTILLARKHNTIVAKLKEFPSWKGPMALCLQPNHLEKKELAIKRAEEVLKE